MQRKNSGRVYGGGGCMGGRGNENGIEEGVEGEDGYEKVKVGGA